MSKLVVKEIDGVFVVDSREVAEKVEKDHKNLLRDINKYITVLDSSNLSSHNFFIKSTYVNVQNKIQPCYLLTRKGCDMVANKMTGEKGILFTAEYVTKFEEMEKGINNKPIALTPMEQLKLQYEVLDDHETRVSKIENALESMEITPLQRKEIQRAKSSKIIKLLNGKKSEAYLDKSFRARVYSEINREYQNYFEINSYEYTPKNRFNEALEFIEEYSLSTELKMELKKINNQITF